MKAKDIVQVLPHAEQLTKAEFKAAKPTPDPHSDFVFVKPFGEILMSRVWMAGKKYVDRHAHGAEHMCIIKPWWCPPEYIQNYKAACKDWEANGFKMCQGTTSLGSEPDIIPGPDHERGPSKPFCASTRGYIAKTGWKKLWLEITDAQKAKAFLSIRTDVPLPVLMDCVQYERNADYRAVYDTCRDYFWYYFEFLVPKKL